MNETTLSNRFTTLQLVMTALMAAVICLLAPLSIPLPSGLVPISLGTFAVYLTASLLGPKRGALSVLLYLLLGLVGMPVFSGYSSGAGILFGPTGGYLVGYIPLVILCGICFKKTDRRWLIIPGAIGATLVLYWIGTAWLMYTAKLSLPAALMAGMIPFIPGDLAKIIVTVLAGPEISKRLRQAGIEI